MNAARAVSVVVLCFFALFLSNAQAQISDQTFSDPFSDEPEFLPVEQAFQFDFRQQSDVLQVTFTIEPGYYLYKHQFSVSSSQAQVGEPELPEGKEKHDEFFGLTQVYYDEVTLRVPIKSASADAAVKLRFQGCADAGFCYPPQTKTLYLEAVGQNSTSERPPAPTTSSQFGLADRLADDENIWLTLGIFLVLGIGLAFTPCVFPMYPILSGIIVGQGKKATLSSSLWLSVVYIQGMALTYSLLGIVVALAGVQFQAALQHPVILWIFIAIFVLLAVAMFGAINLQLPSGWQTRLNALSTRQRGGTLAGVFVMGALSGLIASPCTTAPLTGILLFIAQSGDVFLGFISLYVLSLGMGIPLIVFGVTGGKLLPKAGNWMNVVKVTFGFMMLAVAIVFIERLWSSSLTVLLWALLGMSLFSYFWVINGTTRASFGKGVRTFIIFAGLFSSAMLVYHTYFSSVDVAKAHPEFIQVTNVQELETQIAKASEQGKSVMVDLYADWCVACKEFERYTFPHPEVVDALSSTVMVQIDLTAQNAEDIAFMRQYDVLGLPTILFFDSSGNELTQARVAGFMGGEAFADHVRQTLNEPDA
ncbi:protein-disulfide reductase DsbD [Salinimonas iocasae]|uniref:Thiol:disulfide interchange protein DsbD n=1 Tax=Salinimonas iocasae TaxID=2572577 RepID=A0A5B7YH42_9ALTE|nr:protein-disulfide reductase DsbD [Salinimonas iocasae]QCZ94951.1 protein-disulfide reductase DsbD [Salinimonas iocasae]